MKRLLFGKTLLATLAASLAIAAGAAGQPPVQCPKTRSDEKKAEAAFCAMPDKTIAARVMKWEGVHNVRDLGGLPGADGKIVRRGLVFRSSGLNQNAHYLDKERKKLPKEQWTGPGAVRIGEKSRAYLVDSVGVKTDLDLRSPPEVFKMTGSPLGDKVRWICISSACYKGMGSESGRKAFAEAFKVFLDEKNYPIVFHCIAGADRTGSLACILNGLLGVDEDLLYRDWVFTWTNAKHPSLPNEKHWPGLMSVFDKYEGATLNARIEAYVLSCGFTHEDIAKFRKIMMD